MTDLVATYRPELQALRAVAIAAVVIEHSWPGAAPGGYVGVDVFFVVSGFLITSQLMREHAATGLIRLRRFYLRRARRLLPSAAIVLVATAGMTFLVVPWREWREYFTEIGASALYVQNWAILAGPDATTAVRHFWSLSVEEQFYFVWPLMLIAAIALAVAVRRPRALVVGVVLGVIAAASLAYSIVMTGLDYQVAYFSTFARVWEFAIGGLVALLPLRIPGRWADVALWLGLAAIAGAIFGIRDATAFPGVLALLPVLGTVAIIVASHEGVPGSARALVNLRPVQWLGAISYALYLWHWPVLLFAPLAIGVPSPTWFMVILLSGAVVLAWATTRFVENPVRRIPLVDPGFRVPRRLIAAGVAGGLLLTVGLSTAGAAAELERKAELRCLERSAQQVD